MMNVKNLNFRMTTSVFAIAAGLIVSGCSSSPLDAKSKGPTLELQSSKAAKTVALCIAEKWENLYKIGSLSLRPSQNGYTVIQQDQIMGGKDVPFLAEVEEHGTGSMTTYYNNALSARKIDQAVMDCQK